MRLVLALSVLALIAAAHAAPHAKPQPAARAVTVHAQIVSGTPQTARAYVEPGAAKYLTDFPVLLVVAVDATPLEGEKRRVRFHCATKGCAFVAADQPNEGNDVHEVTTNAVGAKRVVDTTTKDADVVKGRASIHIAVEADRPDVTYTVTATPIVQIGERAVPASFTLTSR